MYITGSSTPGTTPCVLGKVVTEGSNFLPAWQTFPHQEGSPSALLLASTSFPARQRHAQHQQIRSPKQKLDLVETENGSKTNLFVVSKSHIQRPLWLPTVGQDNLQGLKNSHLETTVTDSSFLWGRNPTTLCLSSMAPRPKMKSCPSWWIMSPRNGSSNHLVNGNRSLVQHRLDISLKYQNFAKISEFCRNFKILPKF